MTIAEVRKLMLDLESDRIERTTSFKEDKLGQAVCAFSNDFPNHRKPGFILLDVDNDGKVAGITIDDDKLQQIGNVKANGNVLPQPSIVVSEVMQIDGGDVVVEVRPSYYPPVRYSGRCWIRVGPRRSIAADLDPQSNLTSMFLTDERLEEIYENEQPFTVLDSIKPVVSGDPFQPVHIEKINDKLGLIIGNLALSTFEDNLSDAWLKCLNKDIYSFRITSIFNTILKDAAQRWDAEYVLIDVGPNLGAINRAVTISSDYIIMPVASDLFSLQGIKNLGTTLSAWKEQWQQRKEYKPENTTFEIPQKAAHPAGYIVMQYSAKESRPVKAYLKWANRIPAIFAEFVLKESKQPKVSVENDKYCISLLKHYRSLAPMSMEAHKPIFLLKPADGAIGAHLYAVQKSYEEFSSLTKKITEYCQ